MVKIALGLEYDGSHFHGWQHQVDCRTVQNEVEQALSKIANHDIRVHVAGRTDTGVHASGQVIHFETEQQRNVRAWTFGVNSHLPKDICVRWMRYTDDDFHARYHAEYRQYRYLIFNSPNRPALFQSQLTWQYRQLDHKLMHQAAQHLIGEHDFSSYRAISCQSKTPVRTLTHLNVNRRGDLIVIDVRANAFLHHMVRNIAGVLISVGLEKQDVDWTKELLEAKDRKLGAETAPPNGLYLVRVKYPDRYSLPKQSAGPVFCKEFGLGAL